jgi:hypothetical protein
MRNVRDVNDTKLSFCLAARLCCWASSSALLFSLVLTAKIYLSHRRLKLRMKLKNGMRTIPNKLSRRGAERRHGVVKFISERFEFVAGPTGLLGMGCRSCRI